MDVLGRQAINYSTKLLNIQTSCMLISVLRLCNKRVLDRMTYFCIFPEQAGIIDYLQKHIPLLMKRFKTHLSDVTAREKNKRILDHHGVFLISRIYGDDDRRLKFQHRMTSAERQMKTALESQPMSHHELASWMINLFINSIKHVCLLFHKNPKPICFALLLYLTLNTKKNYNLIY